MIVLAREHVVRERERERERYRKKRRRVARVENATPDLYCQEAVRTGHVAASGKVEAGRKRKKGRENGCLRKRVNWIWESVMMINDKKKK